MKSEMWLTPDEVAENSEEYIRVSYFIQTDNMPLAEAAEKIAIEGTTGTWVRAAHETSRIRERHAAKPFKITHYKNANMGQIDIAYPLENFDPIIGGIPAFLNAVAGTVFALGFLQNVKILDVMFPRKFLEKFSGPKFGTEGIKNILKQTKRPLLSTAIKPNVGLDSKAFAEVCYEVAKGGVDIILDDELLVNPECCTLEKRVREVTRLLEKAEAETGEPKIYGANITTWADRVVPLAKKAVSLGAKMVALNVITAGYCAARALSEDASVSVPIRAYRHMHAAFTRSPYHGIDMRVICKLSRIVGVDAIDTGAFGRLADDAVEVQDYNRVLNHKWLHFKAVFPVISGGVHPGSVETNLRLFGLDTIIHASGAIYGHPQGPRSGARAMRQAIEAVVDGTQITEARKKSKELAVALSKEGWDYKPMPSELEELCEFTSSSTEQRK